MKRWMVGMAATLIAAASVHAEGAVTLSQMADDTPSADFGLQCGFLQTYALSIWRRFRLDEHGIRGSATVGSVTVAAASGDPTTITVNLYRIPRSVDGNTLPVPLLKRIGTATATTNGAPLTTIDVPVAGTIQDALEFDLVAEYHVDDFPGQYRFGANDSEETHEAYLSAPACAEAEPTLLSRTHFFNPSSHPILVVGITETGPGLPRVSSAFGVETVPVGMPARLTLTLSNETRPAATTLAAELVDRLPPGLVVAAAPNAATTCATGSVTAAAGTNTVTLGAGARIPASGTCTVAVDVRAAGTGRYVNTVAAGSLVTDAGANANTAASVLMVLSDAPPTFPPGENFDLNPAPALPNGWTSSSTAGANDWITVPSSESMPNAAWVHDLPEETDYTLDSPAFVPVEGQNVTFRQRYKIDRVTGYAQYGIDGAALEISIDGGEFVDILDAGGSFAAGGYNVTVAGYNALTSRRAWAGDTEGAFVTTTATLPAAATGRQVRLRFHFADDNDPVDPFVQPVFDPNRGWWIDSISLGIAQPPVATIGPASLALTVAANDSATATLTVANGYGKDPLDYAVRAHDAGAAASAPVLRMPAPSRPRSTVSPDAVSYRFDDGVPETAYGFGRASDEPAGERPAVWVNRFHAAAALTVDSISVYWPAAAQAGGDLHGLQANLVVYYDADADGNPANAVRVGGDRLVSITRTGEFETYTTDFAVPGEGDVYVGFIDQWAIGGYYRPQLFPAALDYTTPQGHSYVSVADIGWRLNLADLSQNYFTGTVEGATGGTQSGNWLIRATSTGEPTQGPCTGLSVNWLTAVPAGGTVDGGTSKTVTVRATPAVAGLAPGHYTHQLCIATSDPEQPLVVVPVELTVTQSPCATSDALFCNGFEPAFVQPVRDPSLEAITYARGPNPNWASRDGLSDQTVFNIWQSSEVSAHTGFIGAMFGGRGRLGSPSPPYVAYFEQTVTFPTGGVLFLNYWRFTNLPADTPSPFTVTIDGERVDGADLSAQFDGGFVPHSVDVSAWADGAAHTVRFEYSYRGAYRDGLTSVDDVTLERRPLR